MRAFLITLAAAALSLTTPAVAGSHAVKNDGSERVLHVDTRGNGPVHRQIALAAGKAAVIELDSDTRDVLVSDPAILDAVVRAPRRIFLIGRNIGQANAFFFDAQGKQLLQIDVRVEKDTGELANMIRTEIPDADVHVESLNGSVVLSGSVNSPSDAARAGDIAARYAADPSKPDDKTHLVNMLRVKGGEQVMLKVRVAEVQRQIAKQFGFNVQAGGLLGSVPVAFATDNQFALLGRALSDLSGISAGQFCFGKTQNNLPCDPAQATVKALERVGLLHTLAEPNMTAVSGETAKFLAGGEFPVPASRDRDGNITIQFKQFGVGLSFTPVVLSSGRISIQLSTEVSELSSTGAFTQPSTTSSSTQNGVTTTVTAPGLTIPALNVRRAETTVELPSGGSFAIAGLMEHTTKQSIDALPGLKELPVLGALFRSRDFENDETELVVLVTAYMVNPTAEARLTTPSAGFRPPTDIDTILNGNINNMHGRRTSAPANALSQGQTGFIVR